MATKKQKREAGEARALIEAANSKASGLAALKKDRDRREAQAAKALRDAKKANKNPDDKGVNA